MDHPGAAPADTDPRLLRLGFGPADVQDVARLTEMVSTRPEWRAEVERLATGLRERIGRVDDRTDPLESLRPAPAPGDVEGGSLFTLLALVEIAEATLAEYRRRGVVENLGWRSLSDLGRQVGICRRVHGRFGLHVPDWAAMGFTGGTLWVGRLQFTLEPCPWDADRHVLGVHIPDDGPLTPAAVDAAVAEAVPLARRAFPEADIAALTCTSWLLDPGWASALPSGSNLVAFARRFEPFGTPRDGRRDALYFVFDVETRFGGRVDPGALPRRTSLERAVVERLTRGDRLLTPAGRILLTPPS